MRRPIVYAAVLVLAGTLTGLYECPVSIRLAAISAAFLFFLFFWDTSNRSQFSSNSPRLRTFRKTLFLIISLLCFAAGFFRALLVSDRYHTPEATAFFESFRATNPGQFDYSLYLKGQGIADTASYEVYKAKKDGENESGPGAAKQFCSDALTLNFDETDAGLYRAILLGDRSDMDAEIRNLYQTSGISHLLAVSGLHIGILGMGLTAILKRLRLKTVPRILISSAVLIGYTQMCGAQASTVRAVIMLILSLIAAGSNRNYCMRSAVALSLILVLLYRPYQAFSGGFQLSFGAVLAISIVGEQLIRGTELWRGRCRSTDRFVRAPHANVYVKRIPKRFRLPVVWKTILMSAAIQLTLLPIMAWHYFTFAPYGILLNLVVIPLMAGVVYSGLAVILLSAVLRVISFFLPVSAPLISSLPIAAGAPGHFILQFYEILCRSAQKLPGAEVCIGRPGLHSILTYYVILFTVCAAVSGTIRNVNRLRFVPQTKYVLQGRRFFPALILVLLILNSCLLPPHLSKAFSCTALDVGQGDGFVISEAGRTVLIDGGSTSNKNLGERILIPYLLAQKRIVIDQAILSHADFDHYSGILDLLQNQQQIRIKELVLPAAAAADEAYRELMEAAETAGSRIHILQDGEQLMLSGDCELRCIYAGAKEGTEDRNRESAVLQLTKGNKLSILFTGDAATEDDETILRGLKHWQRETRCSVLKVAHHGSSTGSSAAFLDAVRPDHALLSYKKNNRYGHPAKEVVERLSKRDIELWKTAECGAVTMTVASGEKPVRIEGFLDSAG